MTTPINISDLGDKITVELTPDQLLLIICALRVDNYQYASDYRAQKYQLERELAAASKVAQDFRLVEVPR